MKEVKRTEESPELKPKKFIKIKTTQQTNKKTNQEKQATHNDIKKLLYFIMNRNTRYGQYMVLSFKILKDIPS